MEMSPKHFYQFGPFLLDPAERILTRAGTPVPLTPKAFDTLLVLVRHSSHIVEKEELFKEVWPDTFVEDGNLAVNIFALRKALGRADGGGEYIETIPKRGYRFTGRVRESVPGDQDFVDRNHSGTRPQSSIQQKKPLRLFYGLALAAIILLLAFAALRVPFLRSRLDVGKRAVPEVSAPRILRRSVAVLGFKNLARRPEEDWLSTALAEMLATELAAGGQLRIVPGEAVARLRSNTALPEVDGLSRDTLLQLHRQLEADYVVLGSYTALRQARSNRIRLDLRIEDATAGELIASVAETGEEADLFNLASQAGAQLRQQLRVAQVSEADAASVRAASPANSEAMRLYAQGLAKLRVFDALGARDLLTKTVAAEPTYPLAHSALARAWTALGYDAKASAEAKRAVDLSGKLSQQDRLAVEALYYESEWKWEKAIDIYKSLFTVFPDNLEYGLELAAAQTWAGKANEALATFVSLRTLPAPASDDPRIDLGEAKSAEARGDFKSEEAQAEKAELKARAEGAQLLLAEALLRKCWALAYLTAPEQAFPNCKQAQELFGKAGDRFSASKALQFMADMYSEQGKFRETFELYYEGLRLDEEIGSKRGAAAIRNNMAMVYQSQGDLLQAKALYERSMADFSEIGDRLRTGVVMGNVGETQFYLGDLAGAKQTYLKALDVAHEIGNTDELAAVTLDLGILLRAEGDLNGAQQQSKEALKMFEGESSLRNASNAHFQLGEIFLAQGELPKARAEHERGLAIRQQMGEQGGIAESRLALASISIEEGKPSEANLVIPEAAKEFRKEGLRDDEIAGYIVLARGLLARKDFVGARESIGHAISLSAKTQNPSVRLAIAIASARVEAVTGRVSGHETNTECGLRSVRAALQESARLGLVPLELEARLALCEIVRESNGRENMEAELARLEKDARARGFGLIANKATALRMGKSPLAPNPGLAGGAG
jgi:DNA-binding winged helix-turn-helix (wHTH) protein/tetratricopeptide (TPR) repeat protein